MVHVKRLAIRLSLVVFGCILALLVMEAFLRVFSPFELRIRGDGIQLPANRSYTITNDNLPGIDEVVTYKRNSLGFRGAEPPRSFADYLTIMAVGGSTTEQFLIPDGKTWTDLLGASLTQHFRQVWINNAGLGGHSTQGHLRLMEGYVVKLKPRVVVFLVGINDVGREDLDVSGSQPGVRATLRQLEGWLTGNSDLFALLNNARMTLAAQDLAARPSRLDPSKGRVRKMTDAQKLAELRRHERRYVGPYEERLRALMRLTKDHGIEPVLITQPSLYGHAVDDVTGVDLARMRVAKVNGEVAWERLELYNAVTRRVGESEGLLVVDMAKEMPKSSRLFYDGIHYTNAGAEKFAEIAHTYVCPFLAQRYPELATQPCSSTTPSNR